MMNLPGHSSGQLHVLVLLVSSQYITMSLLIDGVEPTWRRMVHPKTQSMVKVHGVREILCRELIKIQFRKPPKMVTTTAVKLDEFGFNSEATLLKGWLYNLSVIFGTE